MRLVDANNNHNQHGAMVGQNECYETTIAQVLSFFARFVSVVQSSAVSKIQTPFVLFDLSRIKHNIDSLKGIDKPDSVLVNINFAVKALYLPQILAFMEQYINGFDVQSIRETELLPTNAIISKHSPLLREIDVLNPKFRAITLNSLRQVQIVKKLKRIRDSYGIRMRASDYLENRFINRNDKFGLDFKDILKSYNTIQAFSKKAVYFHLHTSSRISSIDEIGPTIDGFSTDLLSFQDKMGIEVKSVNLGGGYNGAFEAYRNGFEVKDVLQAQLEILHDKFPGISMVTIEPGRYFVEDSCVGVATVNDVIIRDNLTHVIVDIATSFLITVPLARFICVPVEIKRSTRGHRKVSISDGTCSPRGQIVEIFTDLDFRIGDKVMFFNIGAYTFSLAGTFFTYLPDTYLLEDSEEITQISSGCCWRK